MPQTKKETADEGRVERLASRGEETLKRLLEEADKNPRLHDAKVRLGKAQQSLLDQLGLARASEVEELKKEVGRLEKHVAKLEKEVAGRAGGGPERAESSGHA